MRLYDWIERSARKRPEHKDKRKESYEPTGRSQAILRPLGLASEGAIPAQLGRYHWPLTRTAGACYNAIHHALGALLTRRLALPRRGRRR